MLKLESAALRRMMIWLFKREECIVYWYMVYLLHIPEVLIGVIKGYLGVREFCNLQMCCREFGDIFGWEGCDVVKIRKSCVDNKQLKKFIGGKEFAVGYSRQIDDDGFSGLAVERIRVLEMRRCVDLTDKVISGMRNLEVLILPRCSKITNEGIRGLSKMREMNLSTALSVDDDGVRDLVEMEVLKLFFNRRVTIEGLRKMSKLRTIMMAYNRFFTTGDLKNLLPNIDDIYLDNFRVR